MKPTKILFEDVNNETKIEISPLDKTVKIKYNLIKLLQNNNEKIKEFTEALSEIIEDYIDILLSDIQVSNNSCITESNKHHSRKLIPENIHELIMNKQIRKAMLLHCGNKTMLLPDKLKFPVMYPVLDRNGQIKECKYHCGLIIAAYYRARQNEKKHPEYKKVAEKVLKLYKELECDKKSPIKLHINENEYANIINLIDLYAELID